ncbi:MAG: hypothetical protein WBZ36_15325 [Candidatus Nitrosopolaris sp.]
MVRFIAVIRGLIYGFVKYATLAVTDGFYLNIAALEFSERVKKETLEKELQRKTPNTATLGSVMAVYRNLRENYEFRLRYDEAGEFFKKEMELKRNYREVVSERERITIIKENNWFRKNLSLTGLYYHFSRYGEKVVGLSTGHENKNRTI